MKLPKLHFICANEEYRYALNHIYITKDNVIATNAHILLVYKTLDLFGEQFRDNIKEPFFIHYNTWKKLTKSHECLELDFDKEYIIIHYKNYYDYIPIKLESKVNYNYPKYESVFWKDSEKEKIDSIAIYPRLFGLLSKVVDVSIKIKFKGNTGTILFETSNKSIKGLIMPTYWSE